MKKWIALATIKGVDNHEYSYIKDAYVNVLVYCKSKNEVTDISKSELHKIGFELIHLEEIEEISDRQKLAIISDDLMKLVSNLNNKNFFEIGNIHT